MGFGGVKDSRRWELSLVCHVAAGRASWWLARMYGLDRLAAGRGGIYF